MRPLDLYIGDFDLVNGTRLDDATVNWLKLQALVYDRLMVYDGFTYCYGPLTARFHKLLHPEDPRQPSNAYEHDPIYQMLKRGIIVPITREDDTLLGIYETNPYVQPGQNLALPREHRDVVELISQACGTNRQTRKAGDINIKWGDSVREHLLNDASPLSLRDWITADLDINEHGEAIERLDGFLDELRTLAAAETFARRDVEGRIRTTFGIADWEPTFETTVYSKVAEGAHAAEPRAVIAHRLLTSLITSCQAVHSDILQTYGSLFSQHHKDTAVVVCAGHQSQTFHPFDNLAARRLIELAPRLDVSRLTIDDIVSLRDKDPGCRSALRAWLDAARSGAIDTRVFQECGENLERKLSAYYKIILEKCGFTKRELLTNEAIFVLPKVVAWASILFVAMGGDVIAVAPYIGIASVTGYAAKTVSQSSFKERMVRNKLLRQQKNYVNQP
jgi:hypothetical protein